MTHDYIVKALAFDGEIRAYAALTTETVQEAQTRHYTWPTASAAMGRTMTATAMMGAMLKARSKINCHCRWPRTYWTNYCRCKC